MLSLAGEAEDEEGEFFRAGLAYALSKKFVIYFTQKNVARFAEKHCRILSISPGCYLTPMHQKLMRLRFVSQMRSARSTSFFLKVSMDSSASPLASFATKSRV